MRHLIKLSALVLATGLTTSALLNTSSVRAADKMPSTQPAKEMKKGGKLVKPWSNIEESLSSEQKSEIIALHLKANDEIKAIEKKEEADIMALLKPEQVEALKAVAEKEKADDKLKAAEKKDAAKKTKEEPKAE